MIVDGLAGIVTVIFFPHQIYKYFIGEHSLWILYEQREIFEFLDRQPNQLASHSNKTLL